MRWEMKRSSLLALSVGLMVFFLVAASSASAKTQLVIGTWVGDLTFGTGLMLQEFADEFNSRQDEIHVEVLPIPGYNDAVIVQMAAGVGPDILIMRTWRYTALEDFLIDLGPYIARSGINENDFVPGVFDAARMSGNGKILKIPGGFGLQNFAMFYRPSHFAEAGLSTPTELHQMGRWTWDGVIDVAKKLTLDTSGDGEPERFGLSLWEGGGHFPRKLTRQLGGSFITLDDGGLRYTGHEPEYTDAVQWLADLSLVHRVYADSTGTRLFNETASMDSFPLSYRTNARTSGLDWDVAPMFNLPDNRPFIDISGNGWVITRNTADPDAAWKFVEFALSDEGQRILARHGALPIRLSALRSDDFLHEPGVEGVAYTANVLVSQLGAFHPNLSRGVGIPNFTQVQQLHDQAVRAVKSGEMPASVAFAQIADAVRGLLGGE